MLCIRGLKKPYSISNSKNVPQFYSISSCDRETCCTVWQVSEWMNKWLPVSPNKGNCWWSSFTFGDFYPWIVLLMDLRLYYTTFCKFLCVCHSWHTVIKYSCTAGTFSNIKTAKHLKNTGSHILTGSFIIKLFCLLTGWHLCSAVALKGRSCFPLCTQSIFHHSIEFFIFILNNICWCVFCWLSGLRPFLSLLAAWCQHFLLLSGCALSCFLIYFSHPQLPEVVQQAKAAWSIWPAVDALSVTFMY